MKRFYLAVVGVAFVAVLAATVGLAQPTTHTGATSAAATKLPTLPANIKSRNRWIIGVKCDVPPFGYIDVQGKNAGFDVEVGRWFARYAFGRAEPRDLRVRAHRGARAAAHDRPRGSRDLDVHLHRRPRHAHRLLGGVLQGDRPAAREERRPGAEARGHRGQEGGDDERLGLRPLDEELLPEHRGHRRDTFTNAMLAFNQGRADAVMYDDAVLLPVAAADRTAKLTDETFLEAPFGIGIKQGNTALKAGSTRASS